MLLLQESVCGWPENDHSVNLGQPGVFDFRTEMSWSGRRPRRERRRK